MQFEMALWFTVYTSELCLMVPRLLTSSKIFNQLAIFREISLVFNAKYRLDLSKRLIQNNYVFLLFNENWKYIILFITDNGAAYLFIKVNNLEVAFNEVYVYQSY